MLNQNAWNRAQGLSAAAGTQGNAMANALGGLTGWAANTMGGGNIMGANPMLKNTANFLGMNRSGGTVATPTGTPVSGKRW
jgi:hypothetical protein